MKATVLETSVIWEKGQTKLYAVTLQDARGREDVFKTWWGDIAAAKGVGQEIDIEVYTKKNRDGQDEQFVKPAGKGEFPSRGRSGGFQKRPKNNAAIAASVSVAVATEIVMKRDGVGKEVFELAEKIHHWLMASVGDEQKFIAASVAIKAAAVVTMQKKGDHELLFETAAAIARWLGQHSVEQKAGFGEGS